MNKPRIKTPGTTVIVLCHIHIVHRYTLGAPSEMSLWHTKGGLVRAMTGQKA